MEGPHVLLLDGSMGHELKERGVADFQAAMFANARQPDLVTSIHEEYVRCGCNVLTTNTFVLTPSELARAGCASSEMRALLQAACECARRAASRAAGSQSVLVAGCLPPLQHCYLPELVGTEASMRAVYEEIAKELAPRVDLFLAETLCSTTEASAVLQATAPLGKPCWVSFTLHDDLGGPPALRDGTGVAAAAATLGAAKSPPAALLYNCCAPQVVAAALRATPSRPAGVQRLGGYANGFQTTTSEWLYARGAAAQGCDPGRHRFACPTCSADYYDATDGTITPGAYAAYATEWVGAGATIVGGCCGVGPSHMRDVARAVCR